MFAGPGPWEQRKREKEREREREKTNGRRARNRCSLFFRLALESVMRTTPQCPPPRQAALQYDTPSPVSAVQCSAHPPRLSKSLVASHAWSIDLHHDRRPATPHLPSLPFPSQRSVVTRVGKSITKRQKERRQGLKKERRSETCVRSIDDKPHPRGFLSFFSSGGGMGG